MIPLIAHTNGGISMKEETMIFATVCKLRHLSSPGKVKFDIHSE